LPPGTTVFDDYGLGGWLAWRHPRLNRWIDGLTDAYPVAHLRATRTVLDLDPGWHRILTGSGATVALLEEHSALADRLTADRWVSLGADDGYVLLRRPLDRFRPSATSQRRAPSSSGSRGAMVATR
jgi:hypothetical protein